MVEAGGNGCRLKTLAGGKDSLSKGDDPFRNCQFSKLRATGEGNQTSWPVILHVRQHNTLAKPN